MDDMRHAMTTQRYKRRRRNRQNLDEIVDKRNFVKRCLHEGWLYSDEYGTAVLSRAGRQRRTPLEYLSKTKARAPRRIDSSLPRRTMWFYADVVQISKDGDSGRTPDAIDRSIDEIGQAMIEFGSRMDTDPEFREAMKKRIN
jgi:hypothetical protein